jgi:hypothetical protein
MDFRSRLLALVRFFCAIIPPFNYTWLLLGHATPLAPAGYCFTGTTLGTSVGSGSLSPGRQTMAVPAAPIAANLNEALDVEVNFLPQLTLDIMPFVDNLPETIDLVFSQVTYLGIGVNLGLCQNLMAQGRTYAIDIL